MSEKLNFDQVKIILAEYYFDKKCNDSKTVEKFTSKFNNYFDLNINSQDITYNLSIFKNIDPLYNVNIDGNINQIYKDVWDYYIYNEREKELKQLLKDFYKTPLKERKKLNVCYDDFSLEKEINANYDKFEFNFVNDKKKELYDKKEYKSKKIRRNPQVTFNALFNANNLCEYNKSHKSFLRKDGKTVYMEGHHLIPLEYQYMFEYNLDIEANVVSLCSECHKKIHYGRDNYDIIKKLYSDRIERLEKCGIFITLEDLLNMYNKE